MSAVLRRRWPIGGPSAGLARVVAGRAGRAALPTGAVVACVGWLVAYAAATALLRSDSARTFESDVLYAVPDVVGALVAGWAARRLRRSGAGRPWRVWAFVALSCALGAVGDAIFAAYYYVGGRAGPFPSLADPVWIASELALVAALLSTQRQPSRRHRWGLAIDVLVAVLGLDSLLFLIVIRPHLTAETPSSGVVTLSYPLLDLVLLILLLSVSGKVRRARHAPVGLLAASVVVLLVTDLTSAYITDVRGYQAGSWLDLGWQLAAVLTVLAAVAAGRAAAGPPSTSPAVTAPDVVRFDGMADAAQLESLNQPGGLAPLIPLLAGMSALLAVEVDQVASGHIDPPAIILAAAAMAVIVRLLLSITDQRSVARALRVALAEQQRLAITDVLTGLYNRRFIEELLVLEAAKARRHGGSLAVVLFDLDHFKAINDTYGHQAGDTVLVEAARRIRDGVRASDVLGRWGGEEFLLVLRNTDGLDAVAVAHRARYELSGRRIAIPGGRRVAVSLSAGVSCLQHLGADADSLLWQADQALYEAKEAGRDRVRLAGSAVPQGAGERPD